MQLIKKPHLTTDAYKIGHAHLYEDTVELIYETLVPRTNSYFPWSNKMVVFGYEYFVYMLKKSWDEGFFSKPWLELEEDFRTIERMFDAGVYAEMTRRFHDLYLLGYLPLEIKALPEGTLVPMRVPVLSIHNTHQDFYWLPGYLETTLLANTFVTSTNASVARQFRKVAKKWADKTAEDDTFLDFQFHDFSQRGQHGDEAAVLSGLAHLTSFKGTDVIPAVVEAEALYGKNNFYGGSVLATEHSVMSAYGVDQFRAFRKLIENNPTGILSVVSDTYDYWEVVDEVLPALKDEIMARDGKLVLRPDSLSEVRTKHAPSHRIETVEEMLINTLSALFVTFGGHTNSKGYKVLDPHVGLLHGEGITLDNVDDLFAKIAEAGFSTENIVLGAGAYVYSVNSSRDSFGQALKASVAVIDGVETQIFKKPKSEAEAFKASPKGAVAVTGTSGNYERIEGLTLDEAANYEGDQLVTIFEDGILKDLTPFEEIRTRIQNDLYID